MRKIEPSTSFQAVTFTSILSFAHVPADAAAAFFGDGAGDLCRADARAVMQTGGNTALVRMRGSPRRWQGSKGAGNA